jgi:hypothetical protein
MDLQGLRNGFGIDSTKPKNGQIRPIAIQLTPILIGPILVLVLIGCYPFLITDRTLYQGALLSGCFFFLLSFVVFRRDPSLRKFPLPMRTLFRFGWALGSVALVWGFIGIVNGLGTPYEIRQVPAVAKHHTRERNPADRTYYLAVRPWRGSRTVVELPGPRAIYEALPVPVDAIDTRQSVLDDMQDGGQVNLVVGRGRLGLEWLKRIEPIGNSATSR